MVTSSTTRSIIDKWLDSKDVAKLRSVARVLKEMEYSTFFLEMAKKLIDKTDDEFVLSQMGMAFTSTGVVSGSLKKVWQARIDDLNKWLDDTASSVRINSFAHRMIDSLRKHSELESDDDWDG